MYQDINKIQNQKNYIIEALQNTVNILENNQKEVSSNIKATIYVLQSPKDIDGIYRFGQTEDFKKRLQNSVNSDKMKVILIYETKNAIKIEKCVIAQIKELRYKKRKDFIKDCDELTLKYKILIKQVVKILIKQVVKILIKQVVKILIKQVVKKRINYIYI